MNFPLSFALPFVLVTVAFAGTAIGHPIPTSVASGSGLVYTAGALPVSTAVFDHCDGTYETVTVGEVLDPVAGDEIVVPPGDTCGVRLNLSDRFELSGTGPSGSSFALSLGVVRIDMVVDPPIYVPEDGSSGGTQIELGSADWVTATLLDLDPNEHVVVGAGHALHDQLRNAIRAESTAW